MDSAHTLARRMLNAVNISNALLEGIIKGFIAFPVDIYYLGHRMLDTDNTRLNEDDTYRFAWLVKSGGANRKGRCFLSEWITKILPMLGNML